MRKQITFLIMWLGLLLAGCSPTKYVPVETMRTEHVSADTTAFDRLVNSLKEQMIQKERAVDSLMRSSREKIVVNDNGDTLRHDTERIVYRSSHREKELEKVIESKNDSIRELRQRLESVKADSIRVPYPVERSLTRWERTKMDFGGMAIGAVIIVLCAAVLVWIIKRKRRR